MDQVMQGAAVTVREFERDGTKQRMNWTDENGKAIPGGDALWEIPADVRAARKIDERDKFRVTSWTPSCIMNYRDAKGYNLITLGLRGPNGDWKPLFAKAAKEYPDRRDEFLAMAQKCDDNEADRIAEASVIPPSARELADARDERIAAAIGRAIADREAEKQQPAPAKK